MDRQGFIDFNTKLSPDNSGKANSYAQAIKILDNVLSYQKEIDLKGLSLYDIHDIAVLEEVSDLVKEEVKKMKSGQPNIFDYGQPNQKSYPLGGFCSAAMTSLIDYAQYDGAEVIVSQTANPREISTKLIRYFDIVKEGEDVDSETKRRKGQDYFRRMILANYGCRCALTGINIPQLLLASHIIPWAENEQERLNPENGICLSSLYDKAFDTGLISFTNEQRVIFSVRLMDNVGKDYYTKYFVPIENTTLITPRKYNINPQFLEWHRDCIFNK